MSWIRIPPPPQAVPPTRTKSPGAAESTRRIETPVPGKDWKGTAATVHAHTHTKHTHTHTHTHKYYGQYNYARMVCKYTDASSSTAVHIHSRIHACPHTCMAAYIHIQMRAGVSLALCLPNCAPGCLWHVRVPAMPVSQLFTGTNMALKA